MAVTTKVLLEVGVPTTSAGNIYSRESVEAALDHTEEFLGELGQDRFQYGIHQGWALEKDPTRIAVRITNMRLDGTRLIGDVEPHGPLHEFVEGKLEDCTIAMRALCVARGTYFDVKRIVAFDVVLGE